MFTGIVEKSVRVISVVDAPKFRRVTIAADWPDVAHGESIAVNGVCLTVAEIQPGELGFDVIAETLAKTNLSSTKVGQAVHVERAMRAGDRFDGHFVQGHVDGLARLIRSTSDSEEWRLTCRAPESLGKYLVPKGSVTLDGVSLTIADLRGDEFDVALIPTTVQVTELAKREIGWGFNLECDILSKTIVAQLERMKAS